MGKSKKSDWKSVNTYSHVDENTPLEGAKICINCKHCYILPDSILPVHHNINLHCGARSDRPLSGDVLSEPFNYYDADEYSNQCKKWDEWVAENKVEVNGTCSKFERIK